MYASRQDKIENSNYVFSVQWIVLDHGTTLVMGPWRKLKRTKKNSRKRMGFSPLFRKISHLMRAWRQWQRNNQPHLVFACTSLAKQKQNKQNIIHPRAKMRKSNTILLQKNVKLFHTALSSYHKNYVLLILLMFSKRFTYKNQVWLAPWGWLILCHCRHALMGSRTK